MFRNRLLEELALIFGEPMTEGEKLSNISEAIYVEYDDAVVDVSDDKSIRFEVPFRLVIYADRDDFAFGYLTVKFASYKPRDDQCVISAYDDIEQPFWDSAKTFGIMKSFLFCLTIEHDKQTEKLREVEIR